jgi:mannosylfructose-phosphate synthase
MNVPANNGARRFRWSMYLYVFGGVLVATLIRFPIQPIIHNVSPFLFYFPVVVAVSVSFGFRYGLLATGLSVLPANYFWMVPDNAFEMNLADLCQIFNFSFAGLSVSWLSDAMKRRRVLEEHVRSALASLEDAVVTTDCSGRIVYCNAAAQVLTELPDHESRGLRLGSTLNLVGEDGYPVGWKFESAMKDDDVDNLPRRIAIVSKTGRQYQVDQRISRVLDARGRKVGNAILFLRTAAPVAAPAATKETWEDGSLNANSGLPRIAMVFLHDTLVPRPELVAPDVTDPVHYLLELSRRLAQSGYEVDIWTRQLNGQIQVEPVAPHVRIIRVPWSGKNFVPWEHLFDGLPAWNKSAVQFIRQHQLVYEVVNSHFWDSCQAGQRMAEELGVRHIHTPHGLGALIKREAGPNVAPDAATPAEPIDAARRVIHERSHFAAADILVATTPGQHEMLMTDYQIPGEKCFMVPPGYDDTRFFPVGDFTRQAIRRRLGFSTPVILAIGRLSKDKGHELLIRAFALVVERLPDAILHLAVGGEHLSQEEQTVFFYLRALVSELGLASKVKFAGSIPADQLPDYYRAVDVFVLSSRQEALGTTAIEAMACGTPTVLTVHGDLHHAVTFGQHGLYADPHDSEDFGIMIAKILKHPRLRSQLRQQGAEKARSLFTWRQVAHQFGELISAEDAKKRGTVRFLEQASWPAPPG